MFQAADKDKKFEKIKQIAFKRRNQLTDRLAIFLNNVPIFPRTTLMNHHGNHKDYINILLNIWIGSRKLNKHLHLE